MNTRTPDKILRKRILVDETKIDIKERINSINNSCATARTGWFAWLGFSAYMMVSVAGVTHIDLFLNSRLKLPIIGIEVPLSQFYSVAPVLYLLVYVGVLFQHETLAQKLWSFESSLPEEKQSSNLIQSLHLLLSSYFFCQAISGINRDITRYIRYKVFITLGILPVCVLLCFQITFLPFHSDAITTLHQLLVLISVSLASHFIARFFKVKRFLFEYVSLPILAFLSIVSVVPDSFEDRLWAALFPTRLPLGCDEQEWVQGGRRTAFFFTALLFEGGVDKKLGRQMRGFPRSIVLTNSTLGVDGEASARIDLRNRDLSYATLDRSHFNRIDFTGTKLDFASFSEAELNDVTFQCIYNQFKSVTIRDFVPRWNDNIDPGDSTKRDVYYDIYCTYLRSVDFRSATLNKVKLPNATLENADFTFAKIVSSDFSSVVMIGARAGGAIFYKSNMTDSNISGAEFSNAFFISSNITRANLTLSNLKFSFIMHSDLNESIVYGVDLRSAVIWNSRPPRADRVSLSLLDKINIAPLDSQVEKYVLSRIGGELDMQFVQSKGWEAGESYSSWRTLIAQYGSKSDSSEFLSAFTKFIAHKTCEGLELNRYFIIRRFDRGYAWEMYDNPDEVAPSDPRATVSPAKSEESTAASREMPQPVNAGELKKLISSVECKGVQALNAVERAYVLSLLDKRVEKN
jgi:uncharacterized protein YjbI with pentapeptide repeats